jgi:FkbM family methyltransferase
MKFGPWLRMRVQLLAHPQFTRNPASAIVRRLLWKAIWSRRAQIRFRTQYGFDVEGSPADIGMGSLYYRGQYEWNELELWQKLLEQPVATVVDVGANIGLYSLVAAAACRRRGNDGVRIVGFEPNPAECGKFRHNVAINGFRKVQVEQVAISDRKGDSRMAVPPPGLGAFGHLLQAGEARDRHDAEVDVATVDLDGWCAAQGLERIDLMKLDVEGHEPAVLAGAEKLLARHAIGALLMEVGHGEWRRSVALLQAHGYAIHAIGDGGRLEAYAEERVGDWCNVVALAPQAQG